MRWRYRALPHLILSFCFQVCVSSFTFKPYSPCPSSMQSFKTHTHTHTHTHSLSLSLTHTHTDTHIHTLSLSLSLTHTFSLSLSLSHTHILSLSLSLSLSLTHTHTHTHTHTQCWFHYITQDISQHLLSKMKSPTDTKPNQSWNIKYGLCQNLTFKFIKDFQTCLGSLQ